MAGTGSAGEPHGRRRRAESAGRKARARDHVTGGGGGGSTERGGGSTERASEPERAGGLTGPAERADGGIGRGNGVAAPETATASDSDVPAPQSGPVLGSGTPKTPSGLSRQSGRERTGGTRKAVVAYFRANPQVFVLLVICLVLGLGTFVAVLIALATAGSVQTTGEPSGAVQGIHALVAAATPPFVG